MKPKTLMQNIVAAGITVLIVLIVMAFLLPWKMINWGKFALLPASTITTIGEASGEVKNQKASFTAGINVVNDNKDTAIAEVNNKIDAITSAAKAFGIPESDIKTQNLSIYQDEESYTQGGKQKSRMGQWRANSSVEITLRDVEKASNLADILAKAGANNVYGPNFTVDTASDSAIPYLPAALDDARNKAEVMATAGGKNLGNIISISEGVSSSQFRGEGLGGAGGADMQPGTSTIKVSVTVTFELHQSFKMPNFKLK